MILKSTAEYNIDRNYEQGSLMKIGTKEFRFTQSERYIMRGKEFKLFYHHKDSEFSCMKKRVNLLMSLCD